MTDPVKLGPRRDPGLDVARREAFEPLDHATGCLDRVDERRRRSGLRPGRATRSARCKTFDRHEYEGRLRRERGDDIEVPKRLSVFDDDHPAFIDRIEEPLRLP